MKNKSVGSVYDSANLNFRVNLYYLVCTYSISLLLNLIVKNNIKEM